MKKIILAAALLAPLATAVPASAQTEATRENTVTQYQDATPREFTARRFRAAHAPVDRADEVQVNRQGPAGNF